MKRMHDKKQLGGGVTEEQFEELVKATPTDVRLVEDQGKLQLQLEHDSKVLGIDSEIGATINRFIGFDNILFISIFIDGDISLNIHGIGISDSGVEKGPFTTLSEFCLAQGNDLGIWVNGDTEGTQPFTKITIRQVDSVLAPNNENGDQVDFRHNVVRAYIKSIDGTVILNYEV